MNSIKITRTRALKLFREKLGHSVLNLNTIVVGLNAVGSGIAQKPNDLVISWNSNDSLRKEQRAREFAIRGLMVTAYDALDHYLYDISNTPSPIDSVDLRSALSTGSEQQLPQKTLKSSDVKSLTDSLNSHISDHSQLKADLKEFSDKFCGKIKRLSLRRRVELFYTHCDGFSKNSARPAMPPQSYYHAVELLLAWRNKLVHDLDEDQLSTNALSELTKGASFLSIHHANIDILKTIDNYKSSGVPTLKDVSTLVAILINFVSSLDSVLLAECNVLNFFQTALKYEVENKNKCELSTFFKGDNFKRRVRRARYITSIYGFVPDNFEPKKDSFIGVSLSEGELTFLKDY